MSPVPGRDEVMDPNLDQVPWSVPCLEDGSEVNGVKERGRHRVWDLVKREERSFKRTKFTYVFVDDSHPSHSVFVSHNRYNRPGFWTQSVRLRYNIKFVTFCVR